MRENMYKSILQKKNNDKIDDVAEKTHKQQQTNILGDSRLGSKKVSKKEKEKKQKQEKIYVACERSEHLVWKCWFLFPDLGLEKFVISDVIKKFMKN